MMAIYGLRRYIRERFLKNKHLGLMEKYLMKIGHGKV